MIKIVVGLLSIFAAISFLPLFVNAATQYGAGSLLQIGDVQSKHLLDGTIVNADVSSSANLTLDKLITTAPQGRMLMSDGSRLVTDGGLRYSTSTEDFYVFSGKIHATSTNFGGVDYTWPATAGTNAYALTTDGAGVLSWASAAASRLDTTATAGEAINTGEPVALATTTAVATIIDTAQGTTQISTFGQIPTSPNKFGQSFTETASGCIDKVTVLLMKIGSPTDNVVLSINSDNAGVPSSTQLASTTVSGASLTTGLVSYTASLSYCLTASTKYWIVFDRDGAASDTNYYSSGGSNPGTYANGALFYWNGTIWQDLSGTDLAIALKLTQVAGRAYRTRANTTGFYEGFVGFARATTTAASTLTYTMGGEATLLPTLTPGRFYYLSNTVGTLSVTAGTNTRKACIASGVNSCIITNIW